MKVMTIGIFWALGCTWLIHQPNKVSHLKVESLSNLSSSYAHIYAEYLPVEFFCNGIISACLTFINVLCIFITAIIVLKIKEIAAPYTSTPELQRFWAHDIRFMRDQNITSTNSSTNSSICQGMNDGEQEKLEEALNEAVAEAINDETFRKIQRLSYGQYKTDQVRNFFLYHGRSI